MADKLSPFVFWGQTKEKITLKIDLKDASAPEVNLEDDRLDFTAVGFGVGGQHEYSFSIEFYLEINSQKSKYRVTDRFIEFYLDKMGVGEMWPRLTYKKEKLPWLKIDFDHFAFDDSELSTDEENLTDVSPHGRLVKFRKCDSKAQEEALMKKIEEDIKKDAPPVKVDFLTVYTTFFNMFMWVGHCYVCVVLLFKYFYKGPESKREAFQSVGHQLMCVQAAALMEIVHPLFGWVKTGVFMPLIQVLGRNLVLFLLIAPEPALQEREVVWWLFIVWSSVEVIRYPYYILTTIKIDVPIVTWLRYTIWIPLYPLGFVCEGFVMMLALPYVQQSGRYTMSLPNAYNMAFHFPTFLQIYMGVFLIGGTILMRRMYEQRKKKISPMFTKKSKVKTS